MGWLKRIFDGGEGLVHKARQKTIHALDSSKEMFLIVIHALKEEVSPDVLVNVKKMDEKLNHEHCSVRKKIYEHLSISRGDDLFRSLVLLSVIDDVERIGDYSKNIGDIIEMVPGKLDFGKYESDFEQIKTETIELFDLTRQAFADSDETIAARVARNYGEISKTCKGILREVMAQATKEEKVPSFYMYLVLMLRYLRRVGAHLSNISSTVINPFHRIGYQLKSHKREQETAKTSHDSGNDCQSTTKNQ